jgi:predicted DNA-binding transcriptional regulator YafY
MPKEVNPAAVASTTVTATPVNSTASVLTTTVAGSATDGVISSLQPQTIYQITVVNTTISGSSPASGPISVTTSPASVPPSAPTGVTASWANLDPTGATETLVATWQAADPGNSPIDQYLVTITSSDGAGTSTQTVLFAVCISQKVLELYHGMPFQKPLELAFAKITRSLDDEERYMLENLDLAFSFRPFAPEDPDLRVLELLTRAVAERRGLKFSYRKPGAKRSELRQVHPYHVMEYEGRLYLLAHDPARGAGRTFVLGRMSDPALTGDRFSRPKDFDPKKEFSTSLGVMKGKGDYQVVVEMDAWLTDILRGRRLHPSQVVEEMPGGGSHLRLRLSCLEEIEQYVLSWGPHASVVGPQELRERLARTARALAARYGDET